MPEPLSLGAAKARQFMTRQKERQSESFEDSLPEFAVVSAVSGDLVAVRAANDAGAATQLYAKAALPAIVGTPGLLFPVKGGSKVFIPVGAPGFSNPFLDPFTIQDTNTNAFVVENGSAADRFRVDTSANVVQLPNGVDLRGYSGNYSSETWSVDGATGDAVFGDVIVSSSNTPYIFAYFDETLDSTTNTATYVDKLATAGLVLDTGTWTVRTLAFARIANSAAGTVNVRTMIDGVAGTAITQSGPSTGAYPAFVQQVATGIASGSRQLKVQFKGVSASTSYMSDCLLLAYFERTA